MKKPMEKHLTLREKILENIRRLKDDICPLAKGLGSATKRSDGALTITRWLVGIGGVTAIVVDLAFAPESAGASTLSVKFGEVALAGAVGAALAK